MILKALAATKTTSFFIFNQFLYGQRLYALKKMMAQDKMKTYFQPIYDVQENKTMGFKVLNRPDSVSCFDNTEDFYEFVGQTKKVYLFERFCRNLSIRRYCEQLKKERFYLIYQYPPQYFTR